MPASHIKSLAAKSGKSEDAVEKLWQKAKRLAADEGHGGEYDYITGILKKMLKLEEKPMKRTKDFLEPLFEATRPLSVIAADIRKNWPKVHYAAKPYLDAMSQMDKITDNYYYDSGRSVVLYFLSNARGWRGPEAKRIKAELKKMLK